jgi:hypothetical protein
MGRAEHASKEGAARRRSLGLARHGHAPGSDGLRRAWLPGRSGPGRASRGLRSAKEMKGHGQTSEDGLGPTRKKGFFSEFNFQCEHISKNS